MQDDRAATLAPACACATPTVHDVMLTDVKLSRPDATVGELRALFANEHVHAALLAGDGVLLAVVERDDLDGADSGSPALPLGALHRRTVSPDLDLDLAREELLASGRRRFAVVNPDGTLLGLLCLKRSRSGFCSNHDIDARRLGCPRGLPGGRNAG